MINRFLYNNSNWVNFQQDYTLGVIPGLGCGEDQVDWVPGLEDCSVLDIDYLHAIDFALAALSDQRFEHLAGAHFLRCHVIRSFHSVVFAFLLAWGVVCCK